MALELSQDYKGTTANYWRIFRFDQNTVTNETVVRLALYIDEDARQESVNNWLTLEEFRFQGVDFNREDLYGKIKEPVMEGEGEEAVNVNPFTEAVDC